MTLPDKQTDSKPTNVFRWSYIALPAGILLISLVLTAIFFGRLPGELAYHFQGNGIPDRWMGRNLFIAIVLLPQLLLTLVAALTAAFMSKIYSKFNQSHISIKLESIITFMGNIVALPGIVLALFMLNVFLFNAFQIHPLSIWVMGAVVMLIGGIFLAVSLSRAFRDARRTIK